MADPADPPPPDGVAPAADRPPPTADRWRPWRSVRSRLTVTATALVAATLVLAGALLVVTQRQAALEDAEDSLRVGADAVGSALAAGDLPAGLGGFGDDDTVVQVVDGDGIVVAATASARGLPPLVDRPPGDGDRLATVAAAGDAEDLRTLARPVDDPGGGYLVLATSLDDVGEATGRLVTALAVAVPLVTALVAAVAWWLTGRTLRAVDDVRTQLDAMAGDEPGGRLRESGTGDEIDRLVRTANRLLARIDAASEARRRFVADASHELRSPLARARADLEVDLAHPGRAEPTATARRVLGDVDDLEALVDDLLDLARLDEAAGPPGAEPVDLAVLVEREVGRRVDAHGPGPVLAADVDGSAWVEGAVGQLRRLVANLLDNAQHHALGRVRASVAAEGADVVLRVEDDGPGIDPADAERAFERFTRLDGARSRAAGGTGLGLAIVRAIATAHGGTAAIDRSALGGARITVRLPRAPGPLA